MAVPQADLPLPSPEPGWRRPRLAPSLAEVYRTVPVSTGAWWRKALAFAGPGYLVAVGYVDPGNWATDLAGGSRFGYALLSVILLSNLMAILLQGLAAKLGIVTGRDLAQACRDHYSRPTALALWVLCEVAIAACDLAEVIGSAIGLNLLFGIPLPWGIAITALDVLIVLFLQNKGFRSRRGRRNPGGLPPAQAAPGLGRGQRRVRPRLARVGPELDAHRDARGSDRDGRFPEHPHPAVVAAAHHPLDRDCAGRAHRYLLRGERHRQAAHPEPGDPEPAAVVRGVPARVVHFRSREDGRVREPHLGQSAGLSRMPSSA